jgi:hypothetical protein
MRSVVALVHGTIRARRRSQVACQRRRDEQFWRAPRGSRVGVRAAASIGTKSEISNDSVLDSGKVNLGVTPPGGGEELIVQSGDASCREGGSMPKMAA